LRDYHITYAYSVALYERQSAGRPVSGAGGLVSVAPGFAPEVNAQAVSQPFALSLARRLGSEYAGRALLGREATETNVRSVLGAGNVLLFATHGVVDAGMPLRSGIQLAGRGGGSEDDGFWSVAEIFSGSVPADLSILGTCDSGIGRLTPGEGMLSIAYAFSYAGCASTVNTLWPVDDRANADLIDRFVARLAEGEDRAAALRAAKMDYLDGVGAELGHPYYWGAPVLQGREGPVAVQRKGGRIGWWVMAIALLGTGLLVVLHSRAH
jgi:CHAT domain-containing protein